MTQEEKARKYEDALERAEEIIRYYKEHNRGDEAAIEDLEVIFPEIKESEDERVRKELLEHCKNQAKPYVQTGNKCPQIQSWITWLEKQGNIDKASYEIAEKEKYDFVSGQFIECRKSFNEFKEDNSYWLEYVGNDTYIGRSDNILNKKFHITPRQLYCLFTQQHCPKEDNANEETNAPTGYGKYVDECLNEAAKHFFSEGEDKYSVADLFYAGVRCGKSWFKRQREQKPTDNIDPKFNVGDTIKITGINNGHTGFSILNTEDGYYYNWKVIENKLTWTEDDERTIKRIDSLLYAINESDFKDIHAWLESIKGRVQPQPKFKIGDWITNGDYTWKIVEVKPLDYILQSQDGNIVDDTISHVDEQFHSFTIEDAKDGDVLSFDNDTIVIFKDLYNATTFHSYCHIEDGVFDISKDDMPDWWEGKGFHPATKEQRDILMKAMADAGWEFDFEKKELKKIEQEPENYKQQVMSEITDLVKEYISRDKFTWSEEDEYNLQCMVAKVTSDIQKGNVGRNNELIDWLNSLKQRIGG